MIDPDSSFNLESAWRISFLPDSSRLKASIETIGIIEPLIIWDDIVLDGGARLHLARECGLKQVAARLFARAELSPAQAWQIAFFMNMGVRSFNLVEKARALHNFQTYLAASERYLIDTVMPWLDLPSGKKNLELCRQLTDLPPAILAYMVQKDYPLSIVPFFLRLPPSGHQSFIDTILPLQPSLNTSKELLLLLSEITEREGRNISEILQEDAIQSALLGKDRGANQKLELLRTMLKARRYPRLTELSLKVTETVRQLNLSDNMKLLLPAGLEGDALTLNLSFRTSGELGGIGRKIDEISNSPALTGLLDDIAGALDS
jgi:hypothetical protein